ncbi:MAG: hypothetical protein AABX13_00755, partial [Nanoarchaeota archaeon]
DPETIERNYQRLSALGLKDDKIASRAELLGNDPETIERNYQRLSALGLKDDKIASRAELLGRNPRTIERNYQHDVGLLRQDYRNRNSGKDLLLTYARLLGASPETIESNIQMLHSLGLNYNDGFLLGTKTSTKRQKMAWMLRELFDYRNVPPGEKQEAIKSLYQFIKDNPALLIKSVNFMERNKDKLLEKVLPYHK